MLLGVLGRKVSSGYALDPAKIVALYHFDTDYNDSSLNARNLTISGGVSIDSSVKKFGAGAMRLDLRFGVAPTGAAAQVANAFDFGNQRPFTISYWTSQTTIEANTPIFKTATSGNTAIELRGGNTVFRNNDFSAVAASPQLTGQLLPQNNIVVVGDGTNIKVYVNGVIRGTFAHPNWPSQLYPIVFGSTSDSNVSNCTVDEFLLYDGVLWTSNFTPPTVAFPYYAAPYWINCLFNTSTQLNDISGNNRLFVQQNGGLTVTTTNDTNGALRFNGTGWMTTIDTFDLLANNFNISCEVFIENGSDFYSVFLAQRINSFNVDIEFFSIQTGQLQVNVYFDDNTVSSFIGTAIRNQWQSIEFKRVSDVFTLTVDNVIADSQTINKTVKSVSNGVLNIGNANDATSSGICTGSMRKLSVKIG